MRFHHCVSIEMASQTNIQNETHGLYVYKLYTWMRFIVIGYKVNFLYNLTAYVMVVFAVRGIFCYFIGASYEEDTANASGTESTYACSVIDFCHDAKCSLMFASAFWLNVRKPENRSHVCRHAALYIDERAAFITRRH